MADGAVVDQGEAGGTVLPGLEGVRDAFAAAHRDDPGGAQLCVYSHGEVAVDLWTRRRTAAGVPFDGASLTVLRSGTKGAVALCAAILIERGLLDVDIAATTYWPEFGSAGKAGTTTAHFLSHAAGLPVFPSGAGIRSADLADRARCASALANARPLWPPGTAVGYHPFTYGYLVGEVIRRITGLGCGEFFARNVAVPLGLEFWIGLPAEHEQRVAPHGPWTATDAAALDRGPREALADIVDVDDPVVAELIASNEALGTGRRDRPLDGYLNTRAGHASEIGAANGIATARSLARMYAATIGAVDGVRLISPETLAFVLEPRTRGLPVGDPVVAALPQLPAPDYGLGFELGPGPGLSRSPGDSGAVRCFGHAGAGGVQGFAVPERGTAVAYTCTSMYTRAAPDPRHAYLDALAESGLV